MFIHEWNYIKFILFEHLQLTLNVTCGLNHLEPQLVSSLEEISVSPPKTEVRSTRGAAAVAEIM